MRLKIYLTIAFAGLVGLLFAFFSNQAKEQTVARLTLMGTVSELERHEQELAGEILRGSFFLYHDYDQLHAILARLRENLAQTEDLHRQIGADPGQAIPTASGALLAAYRETATRREEKLNRFLTVNSTLQNSAVYIPRLGRQALSAASATPAYQALVAELTATIYLTRNSLDLELLQSLALPLEQLRAYQPPTGPLREIHQALVAHGEVFQAQLPPYRDLLNDLLATARDNPLTAMHRALQEENNAWLGRLNLLSYSFFAAFLASVLMIIALLIKTARENLTLIQLREALTVNATTDRLTQLANRFAFDNDQEQLRKPLLFLVNIDAFKHINDLYGVRAGDYVLTAIAAVIEQLKPETTWAKSYRLGGDDFGLLIEEPAGFNRDLLAQQLLEAAESEPLRYREQPIRVTISIGISSQRPLLETADMVLKEVKKSRRQKFLIYQEAFNLQERISTNLGILQTARQALANDQVLAYYQPIVDNRSGAVAKYECLVRLRDEEGTVLSPFAFLDLVKESSLYPEFTKRVVEKSFAAFRDLACGFSLNLAIADILDDEVRNFIIARITGQPETARRLTFEILENEGVENAEMVQAFIARVKEAGCQIAIDDFGAGYSNFAHILKLSVDAIKIDASLIRNLDRDPQARIMVRTIVDFCRQLHIQTVAEFVHSAEIHAIVREMGVDFSQGYHLGKPAPTPEQPL